MEGLAALSLAGNILQFLQFAFGLLSSAQQIQDHGSSADQQHVQGIHTRLLEFQSLLDGTPQLPQYEDEGQARQDDKAAVQHSLYALKLAQLVGTCRGHCEKLLTITQKLQPQDGSKATWWKSFHKALYDTWKKEEIESLKAKVRDCQTDIIIQLCAISSENAERSAIQLRQLITETHLVRSQRIEQFDLLDAKLTAIREDIVRITRRVVRPDGSGITRDFSQGELQILTAAVSELSLQEQQFTNEEAILGSLNFDQRPVRYEAIAVAHTKTFNWILSRDPGGQGDGRHCFIDWLERGDGIYWISGKPGSGKSTLMKFVARQTQTMRYLTTWAGPHRIVLASHFFWNAGSPIQRSREGLLRTLLYNVLSQMPELIPPICASRWAKTGSKRLMKSPWTLDELQTSLRTLTALPKFSTRFCFFIDGIDEYDGDSFDICRALVDLSGSKYIKMCISSRPWNVFESYLGNSPERKIYIHDLTKQDIRTFVRSELQSSSRCSSSIAEDDRLPALVAEITDRAQGVFLWVFLVTRLLREGLMNDDSLADLWARLDSIPTDLERFFKHILESVEPFYHEKQARTLQMALAANGPIRLEIYSYHDLEYADENYALNMVMRPVNPEEGIKRDKPLSKRLAARCKGLLEIHGHNVDFLHRTVRDFLRTGEMTAFLDSRRKSHFHAHLSIFRAHIAWLKTSHFTGNYRTAEPEGSLSFVSRLGQMLDHAHAADAGDERSQHLCVQLLDDLELSVQIMVLGGQVSATRADQESPDESAMTAGILAFLREALIEKDLAHYISVKLSHDPDYLNALETGPLFVTLQTFAVRNDECHSLIETEAVDNGPRNVTGAIRTLQLLLQRGASPNKFFIVKPMNGLTTPWSEFMSLMVPWHYSAYFARPLSKAHEDRFIEALTSGVFSMLLRHGADPNARFPNWLPRKPVLGHCNEKDRVDLEMWREDMEDPSPTVGLVWIFLGLRCTNLTRHTDHYIRDLKAMVAAGVDVTGLASGRFLTVQKARDMKTPQEAAEQLNSARRFKLGKGKVSQTDKDMSIEKEKELLVRGSRWEVFCTALERKDSLGNSVIGEQLFQARLLTEVAKADAKRVLPWKDVKGILKEHFPRSLREMVLHALEST